jgi:hypothetical protein
VNIYVACGLTHVPRPLFADYTKFIHELVKALRANGCEKVTYALMNSDPQLAEKPFAERARLCYLWDRELVQQADLVIAEASFPSTGMGIELQIAETAGIPVILCFKQSVELRTTPIDYENPDNSRHTLQIGEGYVSLMALGLPSIFKVIGYVTDQEGINSVIAAVGLVNKESGSVHV